MVNGTRVLLEYFVIKIKGGCRAAALQESMTYVFTYMRNFYLFLLLPETGGWLNLAGFGRIKQNLAELGGGR